MRMDVVLDAVGLGQNSRTEINGVVERGSEF
jgi:hypothetical protein